MTAMAEEAAKTSGFPSERQGASIARIRALFG